MNDVEFSAYQYLVKRGYTKDDILYQRADSPDFVSLDFGFRQMKNRLC